MKTAIKILAAIAGFYILLSLPVMSQEIQTSGAAPLYTIHGDEVYIESDDAGLTHFYAEGHAVVTYFVRGETWTLSAEKIEFVGMRDAGSRVTPHLANATGDVSLVGPNISVTAPGSLEVNILERWVLSDSENIHIVFPDGDLTTDYLEIHETSGEGGITQTVVDTDVRTVAILQLSDIMPPGPQSGSQGSIFGTLKFDFSEITIETSKIELVIIENRASSIECPEETTVSTYRSTLMMPRATILFDPNILEGPDGVELLVGGDTNVHAGYFQMLYPPEGGLRVEFLGCPPGTAQPREGGTTVGGSDCRVMITNPVGIFSASEITVIVNPDGTNRVRAAGNARFELPMEMDTMQVEDMMDG